MIEPNPLAGLFPGSTVTGVVGGFVDDGDDFTLNWSGGTTVVDPNPLNANQLGLIVGETVNVLVGEFDGVEIDTPSITRPDGSVVLGANQPPIPPQIPADPLIGNPPVPPMVPGSTVTGTVINLTDNDEFLLDINGSPLLVDVNLPDCQVLSLVPGEVLNVTGVLDDEDFDVFSITRPDGSSVIPTAVVPPNVPPNVPPMIPGLTVTGTVINLTDNDEFLLDINGTPLLVDADLPDAQFLQLVPGEVVNVTGVLDDEDFDAFSITRPDGSPVIPAGVAVPPGVNYDWDYDDRWDDDYDDRWDNDDDWDDDDRWDNNWDNDWDDDDRWDDD